MKGRRLSDAERTRVRELHAQSVPLNRIAADFGCDRETVKRIVDPHFGERRRAQIARNKLGGGARDLRIDDWRELAATIPADTRSLTGRIFGDPLPGRSALDARR